MVTSISEPRVEDGDSRYMPRELLDEVSHYMPRELLDEVSHYMPRELLDEVSHYMLRELLDEVSHYMPRELLDEVSHYMPRGGPTPFLYMATRFLANVHVQNVQNVQKLFFPVWKFPGKIYLLWLIHNDRYITWECI